MADDITLTVRVRDLTRGDFERVRQRMRGMDGDIRRVAQSSGMASDRAERLSQSVRGVSGRLGELQRSGNMARHEMDFMRRTMSLLGRDLSNAARSGELTQDQFRELRGELERTRLDFDYLDRDVRRHSAVAQNAHRAEMARQREAAAAARQRMREEAAAARRAEDEARRAQRDEERRLRERARMLTDAARRRVREEERAEREASAIRMAAIRRQRQQEGAAARAAVAATRNLLRQQQAAMRRDMSRLAGAGGDGGLNLRFQGLDDSDLNRMNRSFATLSQVVGGLGGNTGRARRAVGGLGRDIQAMSQILQNAQRDGNLSRREYSALAAGLTQVSRSARQLQRSGDMSRSSFRNVRQEVALLRAQLRLLGNEGNAFQRLDSRLLIFQRRLRDTRNDGNIVRRSMNRMGDGLAGGLRGGILATGLLIGAMRKLGSAINVNKRWTLILVAALLLIGPAAQAIGALLVAVLGAAFIALGALALKNSALVKRAFQEMKTSVASSVREAARPMEEHLVAGIHQVGAAVKQMQPLLTAAFTATGPLIADFAGAFTDLAGMSMPGIITALREMGPAMEGFRTAMGLVGQGFGDMFAAMTADGGAEALRDVWITLGRELANLLVGIGEFISFAAQSGSATMLLVGVFRTLSGILNIVQVGLATVDTLFGGLFQHINDNVIGMDTLTGGIEGVGTAFVASGQNAADLKKQLGDVDKEIARIKKSQESLADIPGPARDGYLGRDNASDEDLADAQAKRKALLEAIATAESNAADQTSKHAASVSDLIAKITNLNDINRSNLDARAGQEKAIDDAAELAKNTGKYSESLKMVKGQLDLNGEAGREAYEVLSRIAQTTKESTDAAVKANTPWEQVRGQWKRGYDEVVKLADGMGLSKDQAKALADQIVGIPDKEIFLQARTEQAKADLDSVIAAMQAAPNEKTVTVKTLTADSITALENLGFVVEQLPDGSFTVTAKTGTARENIGKVQGARDALKGKDIKMSATDASTGVINAIKELVATLQGKTITITTIRKTVLQTFVDPQSTSSSLADALRRQADNARGGATGGLAGQLSGFADGGSISGDVLEGPGTKKSDSLLARLSRGEFVMRASAVDKYGPGFMKMINEGRLPLPGFKKGGMSDSMKSARSEIRGLTTISHFGRRAGSKNTEAVNDFGMADSLKELVGSLNKWRGLIKKATSGGVEKNLLRSLDKAGKSLLGYQKQHDKISKTLEKAKEVRDSVKKGILGETNITRDVSGDKALTVSAIMRKMTVGRDKSSAFANALGDLRKKGLDKNLIKQIADAGIEGGGLETASALLRASGSEIASINSMQSQISKAATKAGNATADAMYGAGMKAGEGLIAGLEKQQKSIEKAMMKIAKSMEKAIKKALKIKSPSKVMEQVGHYTAEGFAVGVDKNSSKDQAWASLFPAGSSLAASGGSYGGGSGSPTVIKVYIGEKKVDEILLDSGRRVVRTHGGNVQSTFGRKNG